MRNDRPAKPHLGRNDRKAQLDSWGFTHGQLTRSRGETQLMQGEEVSESVCSLFSQLIPRPPSRERDGLRWDEQDGSTAGHKVAPRSQKECK